MNTDVKANNQSTNGSVTLDKLLSPKGYSTIQTLNEIDFLISNSKQLPLTTKVVVDSELLFELVKNFRENFPSEINQAEAIVSNLQNLVADAESRAEFIVRQADEKAKSILNESTLLREAHSKAQAIVNDAVMSRDQMKIETEAYVYSLFENATSLLNGSAAAVRESYEQMKSMQQ